MHIDLSYTLLSEHLMTPRPETLPVVTVRATERGGELWQRAVWWAIPWLGSVRFGSECCGSETHHSLTGLLIKGPPLTVHV